MSIKHLFPILALAAIVIFAIRPSAAFNVQQSAETGLTGGPVMMADTVVRINDAQAVPTQQVTIDIEADSQGIENSFSFSVVYETLVVANPVVAFGSDMQAGTISSDTSQPGVIGITVALPDGQALQAGTRQIVTIQFDVVATTGVDSPLSFGDTPMVRDIRDTSAGAVTGSFDDGVLTIIGPTAGEAQIEGFVLTEFGYGIQGINVSVTSMSGITRMARTNQFGAYRFDDVAAGQTYVVGIEHKNWFFPITKRVVMVLGNVVDCNFTGGAERNFPDGVERRPNE